MTLPSSSFLENSQCRLLGTGSGAIVNGALLTINVSVVLKSPFSGRRGIYLAAQNGAGGNSGWQPSGVRDVLPPKAWTQVSMPTLWNYLAATSTTPAQPATPTPLNPAYITVPGVGNPSVLDQGAYVAGCYYPTSGPVWFDGGSSSPWIKPGYQKVTGPASYLETGSIGSSDAFTGVEMSGSFDGSADSGDASVFYSETNCHAGEREYGIRYNYANLGLQLYWSTKTNCSLLPIICWNHPTNRNTATNGLIESSAAFIVNTNNLSPPGPIDRSLQYIYQLYFSKGRVFGAILNATTFEPIQNAFVLQSGQAFTNWGVTTEAPSWFSAPTSNSQFGAGYLSATIVPPGASPVSPYNGGPFNDSPSIAKLRINWVKAAR